MIGMKHNLKQILEIGEASSDPKIRLEARRIANDCYRYIMDLCTNVGVVSEAMKPVNRKEDQIGSLKKQDDKTDQIATKEENTTDGVF